MTIPQLPDDPRPVWERIAELAEQLPQEMVDQLNEPHCRCGKPYPPAIMAVLDAAKEWEAAAQDGEPSNLFRFRLAEFALLAAVAKLREVEGGK